MSNNEGAGAPDDGAADNAARTAEIQLTLAQAQRTLAEALLALSAGQAPAVGRGLGTPEEVDAFPHSGCLVLDDADGELYLADVGGEMLKLKDLADNSKRIQLELRLHPSVAFTTLSTRDQALFNALSSFLKESAPTVIAMKAECDRAPSPPASQKAPKSPTKPPAPPPPPTKKSTTKKR